MPHDDWKFYTDDGIGPESPYFDDEFVDNESYYPMEPNELNHEQNTCEGDLDEFDRLFELAEVIDTVRVKGRGLGKRIVGSFAVLLEGNENYGFEVKFWRLDDEPLPEEWADNK